MSLKNFSAGVSNTPAENTIENSVTACVDWVTASFRTASDLQKIDAIFNLIGVSDLTGLETLEGARYEFAGYDKTYRLGKIEIMHYTDKLDSSNHWLLNMSGQACRQFELCSTFDFPTLFGVLANVNAVYTRLDIAIDDFSNIFTVNQFRNAVYNKQCVTRLKEWGDHRRGKIATGLDDVSMNNFYLGSSTSRYFINVYDKKLERIQKGYEVNVDTWVRTEVRFRYEYADEFIIQLLLNKENIGEHIRAFLNKNIVFLKPSALLKDSNRSRLAKDVNNHARWWRKFLNTTKKIKLTRFKPEKTLQDSKEWVYHQVATTLALLHEYNPNSFDIFISSVVKKGLLNMQNHHIRKLENQRYLDKMIESYGNYQKKAYKYEKWLENSKAKSRKQVLDVYFDRMEEIEREQEEEEKEKSALEENTDLVLV